MVLDRFIGKFRKTKRLISKEMEYQLYAQVSAEMEQGQKEPGVWAKAYADSKGDEQTTKAIYIKLMVERLVLAQSAESEVEANLRQSKETNQTQTEPEKSIPTSTDNGEGITREEWLKENPSFLFLNPLAYGASIIIIITTVLFIPDIWVLGILSGCLTFALIKGLGRMVFGTPPKRSPSSTDYNHDYKISDAIILIFLIFFALFGLLKGF